MTRRRRSLWLEDAGWERIATIARSRSAATGKKITTSEMARRLLRLGLEAWDRGQR